MSNPSDDKPRAGGLIAPATDEAIGELIGAVGTPLAEGVLAAAGDLYGAVFGDHLREWRTRQAIRAAKMTVDAMSNLGVPTAALAELPKGQLYKLFIAAAEEDDEPLQRLWANLIASYAASEIDDHYQRLFSGHLRSLRPLDAKLLLLIRDANSKYARWKSEYWNNEPEIVPWAKRSDPKHIARREKKKNAASNARIQIAAEVAALVDDFDPQLMQESIRNVIMIGLVCAEADLVEDPDDLTTYVDVVKGRYKETQMELDPKNVVAYLGAMAVAINSMRDSTVYDTILLPESIYGRPPYYLTTLGKKFVDLVIK